MQDNETTTLIFFIFLQGIKFSALQTNLIARGTFCSPIAESKAEKWTSQSIRYVTTTS